MNFINEIFIQDCLDDIKQLKDKKRLLELDIQYYEQELQAVKAHIAEYSDRILGIECQIHKIGSEMKAKRQKTV